MRQRLAVLFAGLILCAVIGLPADAASGNVYGVSAAVIFNKLGGGGSDVNLVVKNLNPTGSQPFHVSFDYGDKVSSSSIKLKTFTHKGLKLFLTEDISLSAKQQRSFPLRMEAEPASGYNNCYIISVADAAQTTGFGNISCADGSQPNQLAVFVAYPPKYPGIPVPIRVVVQNFSKKASTPYYLWLSGQRTGPYPALRAGGEATRSMQVTPDPNQGDTQGNSLAVVLNTSPNQAFEAPFSYFTAFVTK